VGALSYQGAGSKLSGLNLGSPGLLGGNWVGKGQLLMCSSP